MNGFFYTSVVLRRNECGCLHVHGAAVLGTDLFTWDTAPFADGAVLRGLWVAGLFHPLLCSFCGFTALFPKGTVLLQLLFACLFQGVTLFCVFPVVDRQCLVLARQCRKKKEDLVDPAQCEPWRLISIDTSRGRSRNRELHYPCYMLVDFCAFRSFGLRPHGVIEVVLGQEEFSFPTVLPITVNVVLLGEFLAPFLHTGLPGLQWQAWINGELLGLALVACQEGFFLQVQVWCGPTLMQNMVVAAPLLTGTLHFDMEAMTDTSLVRVTIYIPGGNTLISSRVLSVTCLRTMLETCALGELRSRFSDLREVGFRVIPVHPAVTWNAPILTLNKEKMVLIYEDVVLQLDAVVFLRLHLPPFYGEGAIYCPRRLRKRDLVAQLGLQIPCERTGSECMCYVNSVELTNGADAEVEDGDVIWCLRASPDMGHEIEILSVGSPSDASEAEVAAPFYA